MQEMKRPSASPWRNSHSLGLLLTLSTILLLEGYSPLKWVETWLTVLLLTTLVGLLIGHGIRGHWLGLLIDAENRMSLARLQILLWTLLILSSFLTAVAMNVAADIREPLNIAIPTDLWLLMGISVVSMVGAPLIQRRKHARTAGDPATSDPSGVQAHLPGESVSAIYSGQQDKTPQFHAPGIADIFQEEDTNATQTVSIGQLQMFFFTLILLFGYGAALAGLFATDEPILAFPEIDGGMLALLGISHASFLVNKAMRS